MEHSASCRAFSTVTERFDCLTEAYTCFLMGTCPSQCVACVIFSGLVPGEDRENLRVTSAELSCISLTLVEKMTSNLASRSLSPAVSSYCVRMLTVLFQDMDLMSLLVQQFQAEDQIISHLAAKTTSTCVIYQLHTSGTVSPVWQQKCVQAFYISLPGRELDTCLWSLTEVLKQLLKGAHQEILWKLLAAFDFSLSALCSKFLSEERDETIHCLVDLPSSSGRWGTTFCLLLDLLELLTACSVICGAGVCLESPRMTYLHSSALLRTIRCSSDYFVKKRALLLLKRAVHQKAGEDWAFGEVLLTGLKHKHFDSDMSVLSQSVLTAMAADWLHSVQVESSSFFGGTRSIRGEEGQKPDCVMLRAVSLLLLKSMELHIQTAGGTAVDSGVDRATVVSGYLQSLWGFLRHSGVQLTENTHRCCWVSLLFGEQDDDMMEAAKALLSIFLHHRMYSGLDDFAVLKATCASGCNPHCHFLLLLQSISFDHSILLDFLISTETCFLEYFVRYLKYLRADWQGFTAACGRIHSLHFHLSLQQSLTASCANDTLKVTCKGESDRVKSSSCAQSEPVGRVSLAAGFHLVEYDSSDESDSENMEVSQHEPAALVCDKSTFSALDGKQEISGPTVPIRQKQYEASDMAPHPGQVAWETLARAVVCMSELREVVTRLQTKNLFPYNPSSLLKLLAQVENCSKLSRLLHFNK